MKRFLIIGWILCATALALPVTAPRAQSVAAARVLTLEKIEVTGNRRTPDFVVRRHLAIEPGDAIDPDILEAARARVLFTGYFKTVEFSTRPGARRGDVILDVVLEERGNPVFETGFGYNDLSGWFLTLLGVRFDNSLGADSQLRFGLRAGLRLIGFDGEWRKPISDGGRLALDTKIFLYGTNQLFYRSAVDSNGVTNWNAYQQSIGRAGVEVTFQYLASDHVRLEFGVGSTVMDPDSSFRAVGDAPATTDPLPGELLRQGDPVTITGFLFRGFRDTRNNDAYPTRGTFLRGTVNLNGHAGDRAATFGKATLDARAHLHIRDGWVLSSRVGGGATSEGTPYYERFYLGGSYSIRGFSDQSLSPTGGDDGYWLFNEELRWPLAGKPGRPRVVGLAFIDAGQGVRRGDTVRADDIQAGAGYGVRVLLPWAGTLGMDVGVPLTDGGNGDRFRVHMLLGFSF